VGSTDPPMRATGQWPGQAQPGQQAEAGQQDYRYPQPGQPGQAQPGQQEYGYPQPGQPGQQEYGYPQPGQPGQQTYGYQAGQQDYGYPQQPPTAQYPGGAARGGYPGDRDPRLAEPWRRLVGWIIDGIILGIVTAALWVPLTISFAHRVQNVANTYPNSSAPGAQTAYNHVFSQTAGSFVIVLVANFIIVVGYYWLLTGFWGTTVGKRIVGTWVVTANGWAKVGAGAALIRALVFVVGGEIIPFFFLLDNLWLLWDPQRQCLHDKAASTVVVKSIAVGR